MRLPASVWLATVSAVLAAVAMPGSADDAADLARIQLDGPEVVKLSWSARSVVPVDLDGDGRVDLAVLDNDRARVELLYQVRPGDERIRDRRSGVDRWQPVLEDARFGRESVATGIRCYALAAADLDGDGRPDLAYTGRPDGLTVRYQDADGGFERRRVLSDAPASGWIGTVAAVDLNGDGLADLAVFAESALLVYLQTPDGGLEGPDRYPVAEEDRHGLHAMDADADGTVDLVYQVPSGEHTLRLRRGVGDGRFGAEETFPLPVSRTVMQTLPGGDGSPRLVRIDSATGIVEVVEFDRSDDGEQVGLDRLRPRIMAAHRGDEGGRAAPAVGDFDGDGRLDVAVASPQTAAMALLRQDPAGGFVRSPDFPSLAGVRSAAAGDLDGDGRDDLVLASPEEEIVAWSRLMPSGRLEYPRPLPVAAEPFGVAVADFDGDGAVEVAAAVEQEDGRRAVTVLSRSDDGEWTAAVTALDGLDVPPRALRAVDADQDGLPDLAVFAARGPVRLLLNRGAEGFLQAEQTSGFQSGLLDGIDPAGWTTGDVDGDGRDEILAASGGFARALRVRSTDAQLEVVDQFNPRSTETRVGAAVAWDPDRDGQTDVALIHADGAVIELLRRDEDGVYRYSESISAHPVDLRHAVVADLGDGVGDLLLFGDDTISWIPASGGDLVARRQPVWESDLGDVRPDTVATGDLGGDETPEIVLVDARGSRVLEVLTDGDEWESALHFTVFEADPHYEGQQGAGREPREVLVADVTGDGRDDLVVLVHDRLLVYPQRATD